MDIISIDLSAEYNIPGKAKLIAYLREITDETDCYVKNLDAMLVIPGGGYHFVSDREGEPVALEYITRNYVSFVLYYDVAPAFRYPVQLTQAACAVDYIRKHAEEFRLNPDRIFATGFSAGGHLTANLANFWNRLPQDYLDGKTIDARLNGIVLAYPVIDNRSHEGSFKNLLGIDDVSCSRAVALSLERSVTKDNPPCYIWTTAEDKTVNPITTLLYAAEYLKRGLLVECHVFPYGGHGSATADRRVNFNAERFSAASEWFDEADAFLKSLG
jgi:endo-1,4-beta-xylanase